MVVRYSDSGTFLRVRFFSYSRVMRMFSLLMRRDSFAEMYPEDFLDFFSLLICFPPDQRFIFGSNASRRPSPTKLKPRTVKTMSIPAGIQMNQKLLMT